MKPSQVMATAAISLVFLTGAVAAQTTAPSAKFTRIAAIGESDFAMPQAVTGLGMSPDGKTLIVYARDGSVRLFDSSGQLLNEIRVQGDVAAAYDQAGKRILYVTRRGELGATTLAGANTKLVNEIDRITRVAAFSASAKGVACWGMTSGLSVRDAATGDPIGKMESTKLMPEKLALSNDNKLLLAAGHDNDAGGYRTALMDLEAGKEIRLDLKAAGLDVEQPQEPENQWAKDHPWTAKLVAGAFSSDSKLVALAGESKVVVYDIAAGKALATANLQAKQVSFADSDGKLAILTAGKIVIWSVKDNKESARLAVPADTTAMALSADGSTALTSLANGLSLWDVSSGKKLLGTTGHQAVISSLAWLGGNELLSAARDGSVVKWKLPGGGFDVLLEGKEQGNWLVGDKTMAGLTANYNTFATFDLGKGKELVRWERDPQGQVLSMALSPDGQLLATAGSVADIAVLSTISGMPVQQPKSEQTEVVPVAAPQKGGRPDNWINYSAAFSNSGRYLAVGGSGVAVFDLLTGEEVLRRKTDQWKVVAVVWSPDDRKVLLIGFMSNQLVDLASEHATSLGANRDEIAAAAFDKTGQVVAMAQGRRITLWQLAPELLASSRPAPLPKEQVKALWDQIDGNDSKTAFKAAMALAEQGDVAVDVAAEQLKPLPAAQDKVDPKPLIAQLDSDSAQQRTEAQRKLQALGLAVKPAIQETLAGNPSPEVKTRLVSILKNWADPKAANRQELLALRGVGVLEMIGSEKAQQALQKLAEGGPGRLTFDAQAAAARVQARRTAKPPTAMPAATQPAGEGK